MPKKLTVRPLTDEEEQELERISRSRTEAKRRVDRAQAIRGVRDGKRVETVAGQLGYALSSVYRIIGRFTANGLASLDDEPRSGRPLTYSEETRGHLLAAAQTNPNKLGQSYSYWTLDRLVEYAHDQLHIPISRSQLGAILEAEGLKWYQEQSYFTERPDPQFAEKRGR